ncbi:urate hydroxylase PuuD [Vibrio diazotrophicus]|uniref:urate hydroxylase PuuD n=1 Tax=Vibrio diazotrophicus TaxID=685 RepID=UPI00142DBE02|nr:urate hydroxylase PuuD [Vibrio diazotrophicus]NIY93776.1 urate hydroxylase PuuD [Vibrio diazotrophicus]
MWPQLYEWIALFIKWFHVICGIAWIGASFYFTWLDNSLETPPKWKQDKGIKGDLWAIHGGGFYEVAKYQVGPEKMPEKLHWFKWEAYSTWLTGTALLIWMYYFNAQAYLIDPRVMELTTLQAIGLGVGAIFLGVVVYEGLMRSPLNRSTPLFIVVLVLFGALFFYAFAHMFSGRGAFIHMGALIGSIMVNNVFHKIIPGQRKMVKQVAAGEPVDPAPGLEGKRRSIHNNYFTLPIIFLMISNHYPMIYQHAQSWLIGLLIMIISAYIRHYFNLKHSGQSKPSVIYTGAAAMFALAVAISWQATSQLHAQKVVAAQGSESIVTATVASTAVESVPQLTEQQHSALGIIEARCSQCHSSTPTDDVFKVAPSGAVFDTWQDVERWKSRILARAVVSGDMPFLNKTKMTDAERDELNKILNTVE